MSADSRPASEIAAIADDRLSGATALVLRGIELLRTVCDRPDVLRSTARSLCRAQPSMAGFRTAAAVALAADEPGRALAVMAERIRRAPASIARLAAPLIRLRPASSAANGRGPNGSDGPLRLVTVSRSALVEATLRALAAEGPVAVAVGESRPGREGIALAEALVPLGIDVTIYTDAAIGSAVPGADAFLTGADAVSLRGFLNKVGTAALAALARAHGVPTVVLAGREKVLPIDVFDTLELREGDPADVFDTPVACHVRNPYFERIAAEPGEPLVVNGAVLTFGDVDQRGQWSQLQYELYTRMLYA